MVQHDVAADAHCGSPDQAVGAVRARERHYRVAVLQKVGYQAMLAKEAAFIFLCTVSVATKLRPQAGTQKSLSCSRPDAVLRQCDGLIDGPAISNAT